MNGQPTEWMPKMLHHRGGVLTIPERQCSVLLRSIYSMHSYSIYIEDTTHQRERETRSDQYNVESDGRYGTHLLGDGRCADDALLQLHMYI